MVTVDYRGTKGVVREPKPKKPDAGTCPYCGRKYR